MIDIPKVSTIKSTIEAPWQVLPETDTKRIYVEKMISYIGEDGFNQILAWYDTSDPSPAASARTTD